jgi:hypothetical protein
MAWQDRPYYRDRSSGAGNPLMWLLTGSLPLGTWLGIRVRMDITLILYVVLTIAFSESRDGVGLKTACISMAMLWVSILLHEFGHCFAARWVGGEAHEILMWPLGGLAAVEPPHRAWPHFIVAAAGPAVNLVICIITASAVAILTHSIGSIPWFPLGRQFRSVVPYDWSPAAYYLWWMFLVNYALLAFNMVLVFYPFDAGRMIQSLMWLKVGYYRSMMLATVVGMVGAVVAALFGIFFYFMLVLIALFGFITCYQQRQILRETGPEEWSDETDYSASLYMNDDDRPKRRKLSRRAIRKARKIAEQDAAERRHIDAILAKVSAHGMNSLTWREKRALHKATEHQRKREMETRHSSNSV